MGHSVAVFGAPYERLAGWKKTQTTPPAALGEAGYLGKRDEVEEKIEGRPVEEGRWVDGIHQALD